MAAPAARRLGALALGRAHALRAPRTAAPVEQRGGPNRPPPGDGARAAVRGLVGGADGDPRGHARLHRRRARGRAGSRRGGEAARRLPPRPPLPRLRPRRRLGTRQPGRRRAPPPRGHVLRRRRVAAPDRHARSGRAGSRPRLPRLDRGACDSRRRAPGAVAGPPARAGDVRALGRALGPTALTAPLGARDVPHAGARARAQGGESAAPRANRQSRLPRPPLGHAARGLAERAAGRGRPRDPPPRGALRRLRGPARPEDLRAEGAAGRAGAARVQRAPPPGRAGRAGGARRSASPPTAAPTSIPS